jgi:hypothetical protein
MYGLMSTLENKPLIKFFDLFFQEKLSKTTRKQVFMLFVFHFGAISTTYMDPKRYSKVLKWPGSMAQYPNLKTRMGKPLLTGACVTYFVTMTCITFHLM